jgi:transcriptional regulator with XRE-family HTH domain
MTPSERRTVGNRLRMLREAAGIRQTEMAARVGISQGRVSKLELESQTPTVELVARYLDALGVSAEVRQDVLDHLAEHRVEIALWRRLHRAGLRQHQHRYGEMERSATAGREWSEHLVPGLLQTPDYIREMCRVWDVPGLSDVEGIVTGRIERQEVLQDRTKRFSLIFGEVALRTTDVPPEVMREQLDRVLLAAVMSHVEVGVVPVSAMVPTPTGFTMMDDQTVLISLATREVQVHELDEVARYLDIFERLRARAVRGEALAELVRDVRRELANRPSSPPE